MEREQIIEGNCLIALFMGAEIMGSSSSPDGITTINSISFKNQNGNYEGSIHKYEFNLALTYHFSWNNLMPVVEKISKEHDINISSTGMWACYINRKDSDDADSICDFGGFQPMIMNVWKCCVAYIEWRNKQPKYKSFKP